MSLKPTIRHLTVLSLALASALTVGCQSTYGVASDPGSQTNVMGAAPVSTIGNPDHNANEFGMKGP
jgi:hypothetical protein